MAAPIKKIIHRFVYDISEYEQGGSQCNKVIPVDTQVYAYYPPILDENDTEDEHGFGLFFVFGDGVHTYTEIRDGLGIYPSSKEYGCYGVEELDELKAMIEARVPKNEQAVSGTGTKVTTDENGLVIDLATLDQSDIPSLPLSKISDVLVSAEEVNYLDGVTSNVQEQITAVKTTADTNEENIGTLSNLTTTEKTTLVGAINELDSTKQDNLSEGTGIDITSNVVSLDAILTNLNDVTITSAANNEFLTYNSTSQKWINLLLTEIDGGNAGEIQQNAVQGE